MEHIWTPWRYRYIASADKQPGCVFCRLLEESRDRENLIVYRGRLNFLVLNLFPYTSGHAMVVPYEHTASFAHLDQPATAEMMEIAKRAQLALEQEYRPDGFNIGMNLGRSAGAGVAEHLHLHIVPRWAGDANFVSIIGETRVMPEDLQTTFDRLKKYFG